MLSIFIENLKNINQLHFELPKPGTWLLTGENGCGKTTLLGVLRRIGQHNAFPIHFPASLESDRLDDMSQARIKYTAREESVTYSRKGIRWVPTPKSGADVLKNFGYSSVEFIGANADRISPRDEDFKTTRIKSAPRPIISAANDIFSTNRFNNLRTVNVTRGNNPAFVFSIEGTPTKYTSEKTFSLGELCVLKLSKKLIGCPHNSLFLIDELEMALHPSAQIRLFRYVETIAKQKNLTVIFSTHSVSLIKTAQRSQIIHLRRAGKRIEEIRSPYPSIVLGDLALDEERGSDAVFFVEDEMAKACAEPLLSEVASAKLKDGAYLFPTLKVIPIGGFSEVVNFLTHYDTLSRPGVRSFALLDNDVLTETVENWKNANNHERLSWIRQSQDRIRFLPWTPEVGICDLYSGNPILFRDELRKYFRNQSLHIDIESPPSSSGAEKRNHCKKWLKCLIGEIKKQTHREEGDIIRFIGSMLAKNYLDNNRAAALQKFGPLIG